MIEMPCFRRRALVVALTAIYGFGPQLVQANPTGAQVVNGQAAVQTQGSRLTVTNTPGTIINWQSFNIGAGQTTYFQQQNAASAVLNRVQAQNPNLKSQIDGTLGSNGRVFLVNPNGMVFGAGSVIDTQGFVASTLNMNDADFKSGKLKFERQGAAGTIQAQGRISSGIGDVYLVAPNIGVDGNAVITSHGGNIVLAAGEMVKITGRNLNDITFQVQSTNNQAVNLGTLSGGAVGVFAGTLSHSGVIRAQTIANEGGQLVLKALGNVTLAAASTTSADGQLRGGDVRIASQSANVTLDPGARVSAQAFAAASPLYQDAPRGGQVAMDAGAGVVALERGASINVNAAQGGDVRVQAAKLVQEGAIHADGLDGAGGNVRLVANSRLIQSSSALVSATGVSQGGNISVSVGAEAAGSGHLFTSGILDASASTGVGGSLTVTGRDLVFAAAQLLASGDAGGGSLRVGGGRHGADGSLDNAQSVVVTSASLFEANARGVGDGGSVVTWADGSTRFAGQVQARGGAAGGNGGFIEVSGKEQTQFGGLPDASAPHGHAGTFLLDPKYIVIQAAAVIPGVSTELLDPNPGSGNFFGSNLSTVGSNVLVFNYRDDFAGADSGAIYLYDGASGALLSSLRGNLAGDQVGSGSIQRFLGGNNVLLSSPSWHSSAGALTTFNTLTGLSGTVSSDNSLVGSTANDQIGGSGITSLNGGKFAIRSPNWDNGTAVNAGAITWADGTTGVKGVVSAANSLVGDASGDAVGNTAPQAIPFFSTNYVVTATSWHGNKGAVTWVDSAAALPLVGAISASNSLVGGAANDFVGSGGLVDLSNGKALVFSPNWSAAKGAVTWFNLDGSTTGVLGSANSLVGVTDGDRVGSGGRQNVGSGGGMVILSPEWTYTGAGGTETAAGAITWANANTAMTGPVTDTNSLVGTKLNDRVGSASLRNLDGIHYVALTDAWSNSRGAVTWIDTSTAPLVGAVSSSNSLVGAVDGDRVGLGGYVTLGSGKALVFSPNWGGGKGAVTWFDALGGSTTGTVSSNNSLVGSTVGDSVGGFQGYDFVGSKVAIFSPNWTNPSASVSNTGAITWADVALGITGPVSTGNSLTGAFAGDRVGDNGIRNLDGVHYAVITNAYGSSRGAVTWIDSANPVTGPISTNNSLTGSITNDAVGAGGFDSIGNGKYIVRSPAWNGNRGAVTWFDIGSATTGAVDSNNSLVGSTSGTTSTGDRVGTFYQLLNNDVVALRSPNWNNASLAGAGAITFATGTAGITGQVSGANSLIGTQTGDRVGNTTLTDLGGGTYYAYTPAWNSSAGAVTWVNTNATLPLGGLTTNNSLLGASPADRIGSGGIVNLFNGKQIVFSPNWNGGKGAVTWFNNASGTFGFVDSGNSLVGSSAGDAVGGFSSYGYIGGNKLVLFSPSWNNGGSAAGAGAFTWADSVTGISGVLDASNSLVGTTAGDGLGNTGLTYTDGTHYLAAAPNWGGNKGSVTWVDSNAPLVGAVSSSNSLVGANAGDRIGGSGIYNLGSGKSLVFSPNWNGNRGAVTAFNNTLGTVGVVSSANSLVGTTAGDLVGNGYWDYFGSKLAINSPDWNNGGAAASAGAITWVDLAVGFNGEVSSANSLVGSHANDRVGNGNLENVSGNLWAVTTTSWNGSAGAVTWVNNASPLVGEVSSLNSLVGSTALDRVGSGGVSSSGEYGVLSSTFWNSNRGASTWIDYAAPVTGLVSASNSLVGANANDRVGSGGVGFLANGSYYVASNNFGANAGAVSIGEAVGGISGVVSGANSLVGQAAGDGYAVYQSLSESRLLVRASNADSNGLTNNGRLHIYAGGAGGGGGAGGALGAQGYGDNASVSVTITPAQITAITNSGTNVVLAASSDITLAAASDIGTNNSNGNGGELTLQAGRSIFINSSISTDNGNLNIYANDRVANGVQAANRDAGVAQITMAEGTLLNAGTGTVTLQLRDGAGHSGAMSAPDTTGLHTISMRSITAGSLSVRTDFGGIQIGSPDAVSASDITIAGDVHLAARTGILLAGGGSSGAFAQVSAGGTFKNDPLFPLVSAVPAPLELRNGGSFARIKSATPLLDLNCTTCLQESAFVVTGGFTDKAFTDLLLGQLLSPSGGGGGGVRLLKDPKDKEDDIALEADTCK